MSKICCAGGRPMTIYILRKTQLHLLEYRVRNRSIRSICKITHINITNNFIGCWNYCSYGIDVPLRTVCVTGYRYCTRSRQLPTATITNSQHGGRQFRHGTILAVYTNIKHTFWGLEFVYAKWHACLYWTPLFDTHVATFAARWWGRKQLTDGNLKYGMMVPIVNCNNRRVLELMIKIMFYPRQILALLGFCHRLRLRACVCLCQSVHVSITSFSTRQLITRSS